MEQPVSKPGQSVLQKHRARAISRSEREQAISSSDPPDSTRHFGRRRVTKLALAIVLLICLFLPYPFHVAGEALVLPAQRSILSAEVDGMVEEIYFESGDQVAAGSKIAQLANHLQVRDLKTSEAERDAIIYDIEKLRSTPTPEEVAAAAAKVNSASVAAKYSAEELRRASVLYKKGSSSTQEMEKARQTAESAAQALVEAQANLEAVRAQINPNQIASLEADKAKIEQEIVLNKEQLRRTSLVAPISGRIVTKDLKFKLKGFIKEGEEFVTIEDLNTVLVEVAVPEADIGDVKLGAALRLRLWAFPGQEFRGVVEQILPATNDEDGEIAKTIPVVGRMDNSDGTLSSGLTGQAKIRGESRIVAVAFTKALVRFIMVECWSWFP